MTMVVGYRLIEAKSHKVIESWGGTWGQCPAIPSMVTLPNGQQVHAPKVGELLGKKNRHVKDGTRYMLVNWEMSPTADVVRAECQRRMGLLLGCRPQAVGVKLSNLLREEARLRRPEFQKTQGTNSKRLAEIAAIDAAIESLRAASNRMEPNPPVDYTADKHWSAK